MLSFFFFLFLNRLSDSGLASATRVVGFFKIVSGLCLALAADGVSPAWQMAVTEREYGNKLLMSTNVKRDGSLIRDDVAADVAPVSAVWCVLFVQSLLSSSQKGQFPSMAGMHFSVRFMSVVRGVSSSPRRSRMSLTNWRIGSRTSRE